MQELKLSVKTDSVESEVINNIRHAHSLNLPIIDEFTPAHDRAVNICGSGKSLKDTAREIIGDTWAINSAHDWLIERDLYPKAAFFFDASPLMVNHIKRPLKGVTYYVASHCHPDLFALLRGQDVVLFHADIGHDIQPVIKELNWHAPIFHGGCAGATRAPYIAYGLGYRQIHLHGADSSFDGETHINRTEEGEIIDVTCYGKTFYCHPWMAAQAKEIIKIPHTLKNANIVVHGEGLLPHIARAHGIHWEQRIA